MINCTKITTTLTISFLILIKNVTQIGSYAASNHATFENNFINNNNNNNDGVHRLAKRMDLESCLGQFDVHKNTIIRTGESQAIGGKYLQGIELETMEECQRLCCETDSCDVYIFESKKDGYCYLFECGTPENFHCKFTRHANYTSAVLTPVIRHINEVTTPPLQSVNHLSHGTTTNISQQEWELSNLKIKPEIKEKSNDIGITTGGGTTININNKKPMTGVANMENNLAPKINISVQCGRFQFACHSGECIAVYNACDGIPQCEDGSDEGPECSGANNNLNIKSTQEVTVSNRAIPAPAMPQYSNTIVQQTPQQQLQNIQQQSQSHGQSSAIISSSINNREDPNVWESRKIVSGSTTQIIGNGNLGNLDSESQINQIVAQQQLQQQQQQQQQSDSFTTYINNRGQNSAVYGVGSSTLEQSGLYITHAAQEIPNAVYTPQQQQQQQNILLPPPPPPPPAPLDSNWQQQAILNQQNLQQQQQQLASQTMVAQQQLALPEVPVPYAEHNEANQQQQQHQQQSAQNLVLPLNQQQLQKQKQPTKTQSVLVKTAVSTEEKATEDSDDYEDSEEKSTEPPKKHKHKKAKSKSKDLQKTEGNLENTKAHSIKSIKSAISPVHEQYEIIHQNMALEFRDHDGQSERPGGAVLSLTLGLLITAALAILIGCRMRTVGRRVRRMGDKAPYSHEADFLVNGMYL